MNPSAEYHIRPSMDRAVALSRYHQYRFEVFGSLALLSEYMWWVVLGAVVALALFTGNGIVVWFSWLIPVCVIRISAGVGFKRGFLDGYEEGRRARARDNIRQAAAQTVNAYNMPC